MIKTIVSDDITNGQRLQRLSVKHRLPGSGVDEVLYADGTMLVSDFPTRSRDTYTPSREKEGRQASFLMRTIAQRLSRTVYQPTSLSRMVCH